MINNSNQCPDGYYMVAGVCQDENQINWEPPHPRGGRQHGPRPDHDDFHRWRYRRSRGSQQGRGSGTDRMMRGGQITRTRKGKGIGTGPVGAFAEFCAQAWDNFGECVTGGGPGPCMGTGTGDCNCTTESSGWQWFGSGQGGTWNWSTGQDVPWEDSSTGGTSGQSDNYNYANTYCMCRPGGNLMSDVAQCRQGGDTFGGSTNQGMGSGRYRKGGKINRRKR